MMRFEVGQYLERSELVKVHVSMRCGRGDYELAMDYGLKLEAYCVLLSLIDLSCYNFYLKAREEKQWSSP